MLRGFERYAVAVGLCILQTQRPFRIRVKVLINPGLLGLISLISQNLEVLNKQTIRSGGLLHLLLCASASMEKFICICGCNEPFVFSTFSLFNYLVASLRLLFSLVWLTSERQIRGLLPVSMFSKAVSAFRKQTWNPELSILPHFQSSSSVIVASVSSFSSGRDYRAGSCDFQVVAV